MPKSNEGPDYREVHGPLQYKTAGIREAVSAGAILTISLLVAFIALTAVSDAGSSATVKVIAFLPPWVKINPAECSLDLSIDPSTKGNSITMARTVKVEANAEWNLAVKDSNPTTKGYMTEWTGTAWGPRKLSKPLRIMSENKALQLSEGYAQVRSGGITSDQGQEVVLTFVQDLSPKDVPLPEGSTYRIVLDLEGVPAEEIHSGAGYAFRAEVA